MWNTMKFVGVFQHWGLSKYDFTPCVKSTDEEAKFSSLAVTVTNLSAFLTQGIEVCLGDFTRWYLFSTADV